MKKFILLSVSLFSAAVAFSQVTLTYTDNALIFGDSIASKEIQYISPGEAGANQMWDFSNLQFALKTSTSKISTPSEQDYKIAGNFNVLLNEDGSGYF